MLRGMYSGKPGDVRDITGLYFILIKGVNRVETFIKNDINSDVVCPDSLRRQSLSGQ